MPLAYRKKANRAIELKNIVGLEDSVFVLPWTDREFAEVGGRIDDLKISADGLKEIKQIICDRLVDKDGVKIDAAPSDWADYDEPTLADLFRQICDHCGWTKREDIAKN